MIAEVVLGCLDAEGTGSSHRVWVGRSEPLKRAGGGWGARWRSTAGFREEGGFVLELPWPDAPAAAMTGTSVAA